MRLLLIRHALPERAEHADGQVADPSLSGRGRQQAAALARTLAEEHIDALYASTAARARETAAPLAEQHDLEVGTRAALLEYDFGASSYIPLEEREPDDPGLTDWAAWFEPLADDSPAGHYRRRIVAAMTDVVAAHRSETVAVVSHWGTINAYLTALMGLERGALFLPDYSSISRIQVSSSGFWTLETLNERTHL